MKSQKVIALLLSTALSVSTCMPLGNITALGAETEPAAQAVEVQEEDSDSAENEESPQEEDSSEAEATENISEDDSEEPAEEAASETVDDEESSDESNAAVPAQEAESSETEENDSDQEASPEENQTDNTAPAGTETIRKGAGNSGSDAASGSDSGSDPEIVTGSDPSTWSDSDDFSNFIEIEAGEDKTADFSGGNSFVLFRFTPDETCEYKFYSDSDVDTYAELYDSSLSLIYASDNDDGSNFKIYDTFNEGDTYYFKVGSWDSDLTSFKVHLRKIYFSCEPVGEAERNVSPNETVTLEVKAESSSEISCQWYDPDNNPIEGADSPTYTFEAKKSGYYNCHLYDEDGNSDDVGYQVFIENNLTAYAEDEYGNQTDWLTIYAAPNETLDLNVTVSADDMDGLTYEWTDNDGNPVEGAGTTSCTIGPVTEAETYHLKVSDPYGNTAYVYYSVRVQNHLTAYAEDEDGNETDWPTIYAAPNETVELNAFVSADDMDGLTYEWTDSDGNPVEGAGTTSCTVGPVTKAETYHFEVSDPYGNTASVSYDICIQNHLTAYAEDEDGSQTDSSTIYTAPNETVELNAFVSADDMDGLTYEWTDSDGNPVEGAGTTSCTIGPVTEAETYHLEVSDPYGNTAYVYYSVRVQNHLTAYAEDEYGNQTDSPTIYVAPNETVELNAFVTADDMDGLTYEWADSDGNPVEDAGTTSCTVGPVTRSESYTLTVSDPYGNTASVNYAVRVQNHLTAYAEDEYGNQTDWATVYAAPNETAELSAFVSADEMDELTYEWTDNDGNPVEGASTTSCTIGPITKNENYTFTVSDPYGNTASVNYSVCVQNHLTAYAEDEDGNQTDWATVYAAPNETAELSAFVSADEMDELTYEWTDNDGNPVEGAGTTSCTIGPVTEAETYHLKVSDPYGNMAYVYYSVRVQNHLTAYAEDEYGNQTDSSTIYTAPNETVELNAFVSADDMDGLTYEWTDSDGNPVEGAGTTSCTIGPVTEAETYHLEVSDPYGNAAYVYYSVRVQNHLTAYAKDEDGNETDWPTIYIAPNETVELNAFVSADEMDGLTYEWTDSDGNPVEGAGTTSCPIGPVTKAETYHFEVSDPYGNTASVSYDICIQNHLTAYAEDEDGNQTDWPTIYTAPNETVELNAFVSADEMEGLTYEWTDSDGNPVEGAGTTSCTIGPVTEAENYHLEVSDSYGNTASVNYAVRVQNHLTAYAEDEYGNQTDWPTIYAAPNETVELNAFVTADEMDGLTYKWTGSDGNPVEDAGTTSCTVGPVTEAETYHLEVSDPYGNTASVDFFVRIQNHLTAYAEDEDGNQTNWPTIYVAPNETVELNAFVSADDMEGLTYEWTDGDGNPVEDAGTTSCTVGPVTKNERYSFHVSDQYGNSASVYFDVCVENHLQAYTTYYDEDSEEEQTTTDRTIYVAPNESVDLNVTVTADDMDNLTSEWIYSDGNPIGGASINSRTVGPVAKNGNYTFTVYDQYGNSASVNFDIRVENHLEAYIEYTENGKTHHTDYHSIGVAPNTSVDLNVTVSADDMQGLTYEWRDSDFNPIEGTNTNSCTVGPVKERGSYYFNVSDPYGNSSSVTFYVYVENHLTVYPEGVEGEANSITLHATPGQPLDLNAVVSADETENLTYRWYIDGNPVDGNNQSSFTIDSVTYSHEYRLEVEDPYGNSESAYFNVKVDNNLHAYADGTDDSHYKYVAVTPGETADLKVIASADDMSGLTYSWYYGDDWSDKTPIDDTISGTYHTGAVTEQQNYLCRVKDKYGNQENITFYVYAENHLSVYPEGESEDSTEKKVYVPYGSSVELNAVVDADDKTQLTYEWHNNDGELIEGNNTSSFKINSVKYHLSYGLRVSDQYGNWEQVFFEIYVQNHLNVYPQGEDTDSESVDIYVPYGESTDLNVVLEADDQTKIEYNWYDDDYDRVEPVSPLNCKTSPIYTHSTYYMSVEDKYGNYDSVRFNIYVQNHLTAYPEGESADSDATDIRIQTGQTAALKAIVSADDKDGLIYEWSKQVYDSELDDYYYDTISGDNTDSYTTEPLTKDQTYRLRISDKYYNHRDVFFNVIVGDLEKQIISADETMSLPYGSSGTISVSGAQGTLSFTSSSPSVASVDSTGKVTANKVGTAKITIFAAATDTCSQSNEITVTVTVKGISIKDAEVSGLEDRTYNGEEQKQTPVVKVASATLTEGTDYTVSYKNNTNAGTATVTITGKGNYTGTKDSDFTINPASIEDTEVSGLEDKTYNGEEQKQTPVVKVASATLVEGTDYTVSYKNNTDAGKATVTITGEGNYTGTKDSNFTINPASIKDADVSGLEDKTYNGKQQEQTLVVKVGSVTLENKKDYTVSYDNNTNVGTATATITGTGNYTGELPAKEFTINPASIKDADVTGLENKTYNGEEQKQTPVVKLGSTVLTEGTDYTVSYSDNVNAGKATLTITGKGNYTGTAPAAEFTINPASIEDAEVSGLEDKTYNGEEQKQTPVVKVGSTTLVEGTDYTVSYKNNTDAGKATVTITGKGNYTGNATPAEFTINPASIEGALVADIDDMAYTGSALEPEVTVTLEGTALVKDTDFKVDYNNNTNAGKATVTITGKGNYTGNATPAEFTINPASIEGALVADIDDMAYTGSKLEPDVTVTLEDTTLVRDTDFTVNYSNNTEKGTATATITGIGNYTGTVKKDFTITDKISIETAEVEAITGLVYNGKEQKPTPVVKINSTPLKEGTDYTIDSYSNNTNAGTATMTITGTGGYFNSKTIEFTINPAPISSASISGIANKTYNGKAQAQTPVVTFGSATLKEKTDYTVSYKNNTNAGTATVTFTAVAKSNFTGTVNKTFTISKAAQSFTVRAAAAAINVGNTTRVTASGAKENPKYTFTSSNARIATVNTAGTVTGKAAGTVTITVNAAATANYNALSKTVNITVNKVLKRPGYCHFIKWNNSKYTSCRIGWRKVDGADGYQTYLCWTNGSHASTTIVKSNVLYRNCTVHPQHVSQMKVRAFYMQNGQRKFGPWSNIEYITPSPTKLTTRNVGTKNSPKIKASWNIIYGCNGYNIFITTNPNGKWYWNQSTSQKATSTSAVIDKCGGAKLKKNTRYYVRLVTRRKRHGVFCTVPMPAKNTYVGSFIIK